MLLAVMPDQPFTYNLLHCASVRVQSCQPFTAGTRMAINALVLPKGHMQVDKFDMMCVDAGLTDGQVPHYRLSMPASKERTIVRCGR